MKPDGVDAATAEPMVALEAEPVIEVAPLEEGQAQAPPASQTEETGQGEPQPTGTPTAANKSGKDKPVDPKAKTKGPTKAKTPTSKTSTASARPTTTQSRMTNGVQKPQTNGVAKKTPSAAPEKKTSAAAPAKKPVAPMTTKTTTKTTEKKPAGTTRPSTTPANGTKTTTTQPAKKTPVAPTNGDKTKPKTLASKPASVATTKPSTTSSPKTDKLSVSKTTRPATGTTTSRPASAAPKPATPTASKTSTSASKPSPAAKTTTSTAKPSPAKTTATPVGRPPTQSSKTTTPVKKDASKPATPAAKKPSASPLTRPASTKTTKPDTSKGVTSARPESAPKKPSSPSKAAPDAKTSKPKDSKPTPSKEVSASPKTTSAKSSTAKAASPKKAVGSSTPMPVKRGPKAATTTEPPPKESEKEDVALAVDKTPAVDAMVAVAAVAAAATVATATDTFATVVTNEPDVHPEVSSEDFQQEVKSELSHEPSSAQLFLEAKPDLAPEPSSELLMETASDLAPEPNSELLLEAKSDLAPEPISELLMETASDLAPEPNSEFLLEAKTDLAPEPISEFLMESASDLAPEHNSEVLIEAKSDIVSETKPEFLFETKPELTACESEALFELQFEPEPALLPQTEAQLSFESKIPPELTFETAAIDDIAKDTEGDQNIPAGSEEETEEAEEVVPQLAAQLDMFSLKEPTGATSLGTTVMSPPSSPTTDSPVPVEDQISAPPLDVHTSANPWAESQSLFSKDLMEESLEQEVSTLVDQTAEEPAEEDIQDVGKSFNLAMEPNLLGTYSAEHFSGVSPTSPHTEKEEAVEKAEEEINEDDHDDGEEEEQEQEDRDVVSPQRLHTEEFNVRMSELGCSDDVGSIIQQEAISPPLMESHYGDDGVHDFSMQKVEIEQPFMGPPGLKSFSDEEEEEEEEEDEKFKVHMDIVPEHVDKCDMDLGLEQAEDDAQHHHLKSQEEEEQEDEDVEMVSEELMESAAKCAGNVNDDDFEEGYMDNLNYTAPAPSMPMTAAWGPSNPFADTWTQPASILMTSNLLDVDAADSEMPTKSPADAWLEQPLGKLTEPHLELHEETESSVPVDGSNLAAPAIGMSQSSTLSGAALAAHSSSETSTPEELRDYDSSSGVESRSDKQQTPVPAAQPDLEQDLGIHLERGDGEEEEAETLPADEVLGDAPTAPASAPSSPSTSGDEASDTEGEMQINEPDAPVDAAFDSPTASRNLPALEEDEEAADMHAGEEDGGTPQSANSVASYGFDCSASNSNAHSMAESCGKSPGIFSLENEDQLPEEAKDPSLIKELTLPAAAAHSEDLLGCPVDLLPLGQQVDSQVGLEDDYLLCGKTGASALEEADPGSPMHLSPQHGVSADSQPPYYSAICDKTDSFLAGHDNRPLVNHREIKSGTLPALTREVNDNQYLAPVQNSHRHHKPQMPQQQPTIQGKELVKLPADPTTGQLRRLEQHQLQLHHIQQRQEQERQQRLWLEGARQRVELQRHLEKQKRVRHEQERQLRQEEERQQLDLQRQQERQCQELHRRCQEEEILQQEEDRQQLELQRQRQAEERQLLELQRQQERKQLELQRQRKEEERKQVDLPKGQQLELQIQQQEIERKGIERQRQQLELQRQRQEKERKQIELLKQQEKHQLELQRQRQEEERKQLELQRQQDRQHLELQRQRQEKERKQIEVQKQHEKHQLELQRQRQEEERKQLELQRQQDRQQLELQRQRQEKERHQVELQKQQWQEEDGHQMELQRQQQQRQEEERQRLERQKQLERQRRELLQLQLHQQQQEHRQRRQLLQWQLELEQQFRLKMQQQQQQQLKAPSPSSGLCTIYEAMETSEDEDERIPHQNLPVELPLRVANGNLRRPPPRELDWNTKVDMVQQLINQALLLEGEDGCPPLLYLPGQGGGMLSPLESSLWPHILPQLSPTSATVTSVSSYSPTSQSSPPQGDWTIVELETHH